MEEYKKVKLPSIWTLFIKRSFDIISSGIVIIILLPFFIIFTPIVAIKMKGNPFFVQQRPGKNEKIFKLIKYRTMTNAKDSNGELLSDAERLTKFGKTMRSLSIDELPELFNIFIGDMSVVGPRPLLIKDMVFMTNEQRQRHQVRQGLTGLAQISGRNNIDWIDKLTLDVQYIGNISFINDLKIIFNTIFKVFKREDTVREGTESDMDLGDYLLKEKYLTKAKYYMLLNKVNDYKELDL